MPHCTLVLTLIAPVSSHWPSLCLRVYPSLLTYIPVVVYPCAFPFIETAVRLPLRRAACCFFKSCKLNKGRLPTPLMFISLMSFWDLSWSPAFWLWTNWPLPASLAAQLLAKVLLLARCDLYCRLLWARFKRCWWETLLVWKLTLLGPIKPFLFCKLCFCMLSMYPCSVVEPLKTLSSLKTGGRPVLLFELGIVFGLIELCLEEFI